MRIAISVVSPPSTKTRSNWSSTIGESCTIVAMSASPRCTSASRISSPWLCSLVWCSSDRNRRMCASVVCSDEFGRTARVNMGFLLSIHLIEPWNSGIRYFGVSCVASGNVQDPWLSVLWKRKK